MILEDKDIDRKNNNKLMEEITSTVAVPFTLGNLKLMANAAAVLMLNPAIEGCQTFSIGNKDYTDNNSPQHQIAVSEEDLKKNQVGASDPVSEMVIEGHNKTEDEFKLAKNFQCIQFGKTSLTEPHVELEPVNNMASVLMKLESGEGSDPKSFDAVHEMQEKQTCRTSFHDALDLISTPLWGSSAICGRREEMEDAVTVKPQLFQVPSLMLMDDQVNENSTHSPAHFFGVYDGHGGSEVSLKIPPLSYTICLVLLKLIHSI